MSDHGLLSRFKCLCNKDFSRNENRGLYTSEDESGHPVNPSEIDAVWVYVDISTAPHCHLSESIESVKQRIGKWRKIDRLVVLKCVGNLVHCTTQLVGDILAPIRDLVNFPTIIWLDE